MQPHIQLDQVRMECRTHFWTRVTTWEIFDGRYLAGKFRWEKDIMSLAQKKENRESTHHHTHENFGWSLPLEAEHQYVLDHHLCYWKSDWVMTRPKMVFWEGRELLLTSTMLRPKWRSRVIWAIAEREVGAGLRIINIRIIIIQAIAERGSRIIAPIADTHSRQCHWFIFPTRSKETLWPFKFETTTKTDVMLEKSHLCLHL